VKKEGKFLRKTRGNKMMTIVIRLKLNNNLTMMITTMLNIKILKAMFAK
jgi:hypothetical protein